MNLLAYAISLPGLALGLVQDHNTLLPQNLQSLSFLMGTWSGKRTFNVPNHAPILADDTLTVNTAVGGRYIEEKIVTVLPGQRTGEADHMLTWDKVGGDYKSWWFDDTLVGPRMLEGTVSQNPKTGDKVLTLRSAAFNMGSQTGVLKAIYTLTSPTAMHYELHLTMGNQPERTLFTIEYTKQS